MLSLTSRAAFELFLTTLEVFATSRFPIWEPPITTHTDDTRVPQFTGRLHNPSRDTHARGAAFQQVSEFRRLATTSVQQADGTLAPKAAHDVARSGGGSEEPLVQFERGGAYEVFSPWPLPEPVLDGSHAVYKQVQPDVDLVVQVLPDGFTQNLVVHTPEVAASLGSINYRVATDGLLDRPVAVTTVRGR